MSGRSRPNLGAIQSPLPDISFYIWSQPQSGGLIQRHATANLRCRNKLGRHRDRTHTARAVVVELRDRTQATPGPEGRGSLRQIRHPGARHNHDVGEIEDSLPLIPGGHIQERIAALNQTKTVIGMLEVNTLKGINGSTGPSIPQFTVITHKQRIVFQSQLQHRPTVRHGRYRLRAMTRHAAQNNPDFPQAQGPRHFPDSPDMAHVNRVKSAAKNA